jgi:hypothetical protein
VQQINQILDRLTRGFTRQSDNRRAAILGMLFGLLLCVIVVLIVAVFGFISTLGE